MPLWANANRNAQPTLDVNTARVSDTIAQDYAGDRHWRRQKRQINTGEHSTSSVASHSVLLITTTTLITSGSGVTPQAEVIITTVISSDVDPFAQPSRGSINSSSSPTLAPATSSNPEIQTEATSSNTESVTGFFMNKGAVAGIFTMLCILLFALCFILYLTLVRQRRRRDRMVRRSSMGQADILPQALYEEGPTSRRSHIHDNDKLVYESDDRRQSRRGVGNLPVPNQSMDSVVRTMTFAVPPDNVSGIYQGEPSPVVAHPERSFTRGAGWKRPYDDRLWSVTRHSVPTPEPIRYSINSPYAYPYYNYDNARDYDNDNDDEKAVTNRDDNQSTRSRSRPYSLPSGITAPPRTPSKKRSRSLKISLATPKTTAGARYEGDENGHEEGRVDDRREDVDDESQKWFRFTRRGKRKPVPIIADEHDDDEKGSVHHEENSSSLQTGRAVEADPATSRHKEDRNGKQKWNDLFAVPAQDTKEGSERRPRSDHEVRSGVGDSSGIRISIMPFDSNSSELPIQTPPMSTYTSRWFIRRSQSGKSGFTAGDSADEKRRSGGGTGSGNSGASVRGKRISQNSRISEQSKVEEEEEEEEETQSFTLEDALMSSLGRGITQQNVGMETTNVAEKEKKTKTERKRMIRNSSGSYLVNARGWTATQTGGLPSPLTREGGEGDEDSRLTEAAAENQRASSATGHTSERRGNGELLRVKSDSSSSGKHPYASTHERIPTHPLRRGE
ncbi:hypothetical protein CPB86DRAFT_795091 [Serendipita vermifera]|nr:hypothetical protein CPB86DRAFT_795091 [Serendipita vermifera]